MAGQYIIDGQWKYKDTVDVKKRAEYLRANTDLVIKTQELSEDLAHLEYNDDEQKKKRVISRITDIRIGLDLLEKNL